MTFGRCRVWSEHNLLDQAAQDVRCLLARVVGVQGTGQIGYRAGVGVGEAGVERDRLGFWKIGQLGGEAGLVGFQCVHARLHRGMEHALRDGGDDVVDLFGDLSQILLGAGSGREGS
ncbi:MAG: hypothetical protein O9328_14330 [Rhodobacteraceae bacterium]|nr:hypothetical protein [Paracoccaceae bacterium]